MPFRNFPKPWETTKPMKRILFAIAILLLSFSFESNAQDEQLTRLLFVFDASNSMNATWQSDRKITVARKLLSESVRELDGNPNVAPSAIDSRAQDC